MIKQIVLLKAKDGIGTSALIDRYEKDHAPLVQSLLPYFADYRRNYVVPGLAVSRGHPDDGAWKPPFDVVTQLWFENPAKLNELARALADERTAGKIARSEAEFFDQASMAVFRCDEFVTPDSMLQPRPAGHHGRPAVKLIGTIRKKAGLSRADFMERYEQGHCRTALSLLTKGGMPTFAGYRRSFPDHAAQSLMPDMPAPHPDALFDVMTEVWFWTEADYLYFLAQHADPAIDAPLSEDEAALFDRASITMVSVEERLS